MKNTLRITLFSFCIDVYASFVLHELKLMGLLPANYFIWIAQMRRKQLAHALCMKTKEIAELLYLSCDSLDPDVR